MPIPIREWRTTPITTPITVNSPDPRTFERIIGRSHMEVQLEVVLPNAVFVECFRVQDSVTLEDLLVALIPHMDAADVRRILAAAVAQRLDS